MTVIEGHGGKICFVRLILSVEEQERRIANESRREFRKLTSLDVLRALRADFAACDAAMPPADLTIDTGVTDPKTAARRIATAFGLSAASAAT